MRAIKIAVVVATCLIIALAGVVCLAADDALAVVNAQRAARGLKPFLPDVGLYRAAAGCADYRAQYGMAGHTSNDFAALPPGTRAPVAGCAAWAKGGGFGACALYENWTYAGCAWTEGRDGRMYCHAFYSNQPSQPPPK